MNKKLWSLFVLGALISTSAFADAPVFPVNFNASVSGESTVTLVKVEGTKLRISVNGADGSAVKDFSMDVEEGSIAEFPGDVVQRGSDGYAAVHEEIMEELESLRSGLSAAGDSENLESLNTTISYLESLD